MKLTPQQIESAKEKVPTLLEWILAGLIFNDGRDGARYDIHDDPLFEWVWEPSRRRALDTHKLPLKNGDSEQFPSRA